MHGTSGFFGKGDMQKEFEEASFNLKPGEISQVVQTASGLHLIERYDLPPLSETSEPHFAWLGAHSRTRKRRGRATLFDARNRVEVCLADRHCLGSSSCDERFVYIHLKSTRCARKFHDV